MRPLFQRSRQEVLFPAFPRAVRGFLSLFQLLLALFAPRLLASTIHGRITDAAGLPVSGGAITVLQVGGESLPWLATTDADGRYAVGDPLMFGNLRVTASKAGRVMIPPAVEFFDDGFSDHTVDFVAHVKSPASVTSYAQSSLGLEVSATTNPLGLSTIAFFEYGEGSALDRSTEPVTLGGSVDVPVGVTLPVVPNAGAAFRSRLVVSNALGRVEGPPGQFALPATQQFATHFFTRTPDSTQPWGIQAADVDADGRMDFFRSGLSSIRDQQLFRGAGLDRWDPVDLCPDCNDLRSAPSLQVTSWLDWDHDNRPDLVGMAPAGNFTVLNATSPGFRIASAGSQTTKSALRSVALDLNGDGRDDLLSGGARFLVSTQAVDRQFHDMALNFSANVFGVVARDLDRDGIPDTVFSTTASQARVPVVLRFGTGDGQFDRVPVDSQLLTIFSPASTGMGLEAADLDGDGALDLVVATHPNSTNLQVQVLWNDGHGSFPDRHVALLNSTTAGGFDTPDLTAGDFDNDGLEDLMLSANGAFLITGRGRTVRITEKPEIRPSVAQMLRFDADSDGRLDLLALRLEDPQTTVLQVYRNNIAATNRPPGAPSGLTATRIDGGVRLTWDAGPGDDLTPAQALTWNVCVGTTPGGTEIVSPLSDLNSGRRLLLSPGNAGTTRFMNLKLDPSVTRIFWSVQAEDAGYQAGAWAAEQSFFLVEGGEFRITEIRFENNGAVRIRGAGGGAGAVLFSSEDLVNWTKVVAFSPGNGEFEAVDPAPGSRATRYYMAR